MDAEALTSNQDWTDISKLWESMCAFAKSNPEYIFIPADNPPRRGWCAYSAKDPTLDQGYKVWTIKLVDAAATAHLLPTSVREALTKEGSKALVALLKKEQPRQVRHYWVVKNENGAYLTEMAWGNLIGTYDKPYVTPWVGPWPNTPEGRAEKQRYQHLIWEAPSLKKASSAAKAYSNSSGLLPLTCVKAKVYRVTATIR